MIINDLNEAETNEPTTDQASYADDQTVEEPQINHKPKRKTDEWYSVDKS